MVGRRAGSADMQGSTSCRHLRRDSVQARPLMRHPVQQLGLGAVAVRPPPGGREHEHRGQAEHVARRPHRLTDGLFRRHVGQGPHQHAGAGQRARAGHPRDAEVDHPRPVVGKQHVVRLQVAVHQAGRVNRGERLRQAGRERQHRALSERALDCHRLTERRAGNVLGRQPEFLAIGVRVHHPGGELAADFPRRVHLAAEPGAELGIFGQVGLDHLHRDPLAVRPLAEVHPAEAAVSEHAEQLERADVGRIPRLQRL